jgi:hypothetical protein
VSFADLVMFSKAETIAVDVFASTIKFEALELDVMAVTELVLLIGRVVSFSDVDDALDSKSSVEASVEGISIFPCNVVCGKDCSDCSCSVISSLETSLVVEVSSSAVSSFAVAVFFFLLALVDLIVVFSFVLTWNVLF